MWLPGVRNLHSAREVWVIKATPDECVDKLVAAVDAIPQEELMEISKVRTFTVAACISNLPPRFTIHLVLKALHVLVLVV